MAFAVSGFLEGARTGSQKAFLSVRLDFTVSNIQTPVNTGEALSYALTSLCIWAGYPPAGTED